MRVLGYRCFCRDGTAVVMKLAYVRTQEVKMVVKVLICTGCGGTGAIECPVCGGKGSIPKQAPLGASGLGKSVVSALSNWLLEQDVTPLFTIAEDNEASHRLATSLGYHDTGARQFLCEGVRRQAAFPLNGNMVE